MGLRLHTNIEGTVFFKIQSTLPIYVQQTLARMFNVRLAGFIPTQSVSLPYALNGSFVAIIPYIYQRSTVDIGISIYTFIIRVGAWIFLFHPMGSSKERPS